MAGNYSSWNIGIDPDDLHLYTLEEILNLINELSKKGMWNLEILNVIEI